MGKATIDSHVGDALYQITLKPDNTRLDARLTAIGNELTEVAQQISAQQTAVNTAKQKRDQDLTALNTKITEFANETATIDEVRDASKTLYQSAAKLAVEQSKLNSLKLRESSLKKEQQYLTDQRPDDESMQAWCADFTTGLSGDVGVITIPGERKAESGSAVIIQPAGTGGANAAYDPQQHGILQHTAGNGPAGTYWNLGALPAWQKWKPLHRIGTITAIDGDTCGVALDPATSSRQDLNINQSDNLIAVPIEYLDCNGAAFEVDDRVVVEFQAQDWNNPKVIGFESNPKSCGEFRIIEEVRFYKGAFTPGGDYKSFFTFETGDSGEIVFYQPQGSSSSTVDSSFFNDCGGTSNAKSTQDFSGDVTGFVWDKEFSSPVIIQYGIGILFSDQNKLGEVSQYSAMLPNGAGTWLVFPDCRLDTPTQQYFADMEFGQVKSMFESSHKEIADGQVIPPAQFFTPSGTTSQSTGQTVKTVAASELSSISNLGFESFQFGGLSATLKAALEEKIGGQWKYVSERPDPMPDETLIKLKTASAASQIESTNFWRQQFTYLFEPG